MSWKYVKLGDISTIVRGSSPRPKGDSQYYGGPIPRLMVADVTRDGMYVTPQIDSLTEAGAKKSRPMLKDDIIIAVSGDPGQPCILAVNACIHDGFVGLRNIDDSLLFRPFLYQYLKFIKHLNKILAVGAIYKNLTTSQVAEFKIPLPPLETQKRIVTLLDRAQELIEKRKDQIALMDQLIQSLFYDMFGDPVSNPKGWRKSEIPEISTITQIGPFGSLLHQEDYIEGGIPLINPMHIRNGMVVPNYSYSISEKKLSELSRYKVKVNDLIMGRRGEMGRCAVITNNEDGYLCGTGSLFIRPRLDKISSTFLWFVLSSKSMKKKLEEFSLGATMANLNKKIIDNLIVPVPPLHIQTTFTERVQKIKDQKEAMTKSLKELENNFNSLMQRAFKGEL